MRFKKVDRQVVGRLWSSYATDSSGALREELIKAYLGFAQMMAARYYRQRVGDDIPFEEYQQLAHVGLIEAVDRFEAGRGILFETYAAKRIRGAIVDGIAQMTEVQQQLAERRCRVQARATSLADAVGASALDGPERLFAQLADIAVGLAIGFALDTDVGHDGGEPAHPDTAYAAVEMRQLRELVLRALREIPERPRTVIRQHYLHQRSFADIATELGVTAGRVSQLHREGVERLRTSMKQQPRLDLHC
jgi:RNA polymerase sigma factor for flagellar operon FliA